MESGWPVRNQSTMATRKMVSNAATDESTGDVREMRTKKDPEKAVAEGKKAHGQRSVDWI
jgi:hypothetical protein